jgi:hypothetical protein
MTKEMEDEWGRAFVHESGHALMAVIQGIPCWGICLEVGGGGGKFCTLIPPQVLSERASAYYLYLAAGAAAEELIYKDHDAGSDADKRDFMTANAPNFGDTIEEGKTLLLSRMRHLRRLVSMLKTRTRQADFDLSRVPETRMDGTDKTYRVLLSKDDLESALRRP